MQDGPRRFPQDFSCPAVLRNARKSPDPFRLRGFHTLWLRFPPDSAKGRIGNSLALNRRAPYNPPGDHSPKVWAISAFARRY